MGDSKGYHGYLVEEAQHAIEEAEYAIDAARRIHGIEPEDIAYSEGQVAQAKGLYGQLKDIYRLS